MKRFSPLGFLFGLCGLMLGCSTLVSSGDFEDMPSSWSRPPRASPHASPRASIDAPASTPSLAASPAARSVGLTCDRRWPSPAAEQAVLALVNAARTRGATCGDTRHPPAAPLRANERLQCAARLHTVDMATHEYFAHDNLRGESPADRVTRTGYRWSVAGENIAAGQATPAEVVDAWMESPGHCKNIMNPAFTELGIGYVAASDRFGHYWAQSFGRPR